MYPVDHLEPVLPYCCECSSEKVECIETNARHWVESTIARDEPATENTELN